MSNTQNRKGNPKIYGDIKIYAGTGSPELGKKIADYIGVELASRQINVFSNENIMVKLGDSARGKDVYVIQATTKPVHRNIMELLIMLQTLKLDSAGRITAVVPYLAYARSDKKDQPRIPITARLMTDMIEVAGADRYMTMDLHAGQIQGFFSIPGDVLTAFHILIEYLIELCPKLTNPTVVTTDLGFAKRGRNLAEDLNVPLALIEKRRAKSGATTEALNIVGEVEGRDIILVDDEVDTAGSVAQAVTLLKEKGANDIYMVFVHPVLSGPAIDRLSKLPLTKIITTDTVPIPQEGLDILGDRIEILSIAPLLGEVILRAHEGRSVGEMFNE